MRDAINDVRTADGYTMVFAGGPSSAMLSADKSLDITDKVLARMGVKSTAQGPAPSVGGTPGAPRPASGAPLAAPAGVTRPKTPPTQ